MITQNFSAMVYWYIALFSKLGENPQTILEIEKLHWVVVPFESCTQGSKMTY